MYMGNLILLCLEMYLYKRWDESYVEKTGNVRGFGECGYCGTMCG